MDQHPIPLEWHCAHLRFTAFPATLWDVERSHWRMLFDDEPESRNSQPKAGMIAESGPFDSAILFIQSVPGRVDFTIHPNFSALPPMHNPPVVGQFPQTALHLIQIAQKWLAAVEDFAFLRLALGGVLLSDQPDKDVAYHALSRLLYSVKIDSKTTSDFLYQVNRWTARKENPEARINRLTKWSVQLSNASRLDGNTGLVIPESAQESYACRLEFDINTAVQEGILLQGSEITASILSDLYLHLEDMAKYGEPK